MSILLLPIFKEGNAMRNTLLSLAVFGLFTVTAPGSLTNASATHTPDVVNPPLRSACGLVLSRPKAQQSSVICTSMPACTGLVQP